MRPEFVALHNHPDVSVLIIGGGINGIGLFNELALQGIDVLLVEKADFCSGTSSAPTRIIHGGLRYLENAELRLVREALLERNRLLKNAPHYVKPMPTVIPIFNWMSGIIPGIRNLLNWPTKPGNRGALLIKTGLTLYDFLAGRKSPLPRHRFRSGRAARALRPALNPGVICTATYYDAKITHPERLCLELVQDAEAACPQAQAMNYVRMKSAKGNVVVLHDEITGETCEVKPKIVVNATGPWIDGANQTIGRASQFIGGTKGSHIVLHHPELVAATGDDMIYFVNRDGRICLFYVIEGKVFAGATDIPTDDPNAVCDEGEVDYLLDSMSQAFPSIKVDRSHVVFRICGVRPLPRSNALTPGQISRDHSFPVLPAGNGIDFPIYSLVSGKWTTYRALAEQVADEILRVLGRPRLRSSADLPIGGGKGYPRLPQGTGLSQERLLTLQNRYGTSADRVAAYMCAGPDAPLAHHAGYSRREIEFIALNERVVHLDDLIMRRTLIGILGELTPSLLNELAAIVAQVQHWPKEKTTAEIERIVQLFKKVHGVNLAA
ncbi:MAG: glycerol-3-phosphate dehydrogenase/oxidase [Terracidiphilus sp.]